MVKGVDFGPMWIEMPKHEEVDMGKSVGSVKSMPVGSRFGSSAPGRQRDSKVGSAPAKSAPECAGHGSAPDKSAPSKAGVGSAK